MEWVKIIALGFVPLIIGFMITNFFITDYEILTQDIRSKKTSNFLWAFLVTIVLLFFVILIEQDYYEYTDNLSNSFYHLSSIDNYIDSSDLNIIRDVLMYIIYIFVVFQYFVITSATPKKRIKIYKKVLRRRKRDSKEIFRYVFDRKNLSLRKKLGWEMSDFLSDFRELLRKIYKKIIEFLLVLLVIIIVPLTILFIYILIPEYNVTKIILGLAIIIFLFIGIYKFIYIAKSKNITFEIEKIYNNFSDFKKDNEEKCYLISNSSRYSIHKFYNNKEYYILFHRDYSKIEKIKIMPKYYRISKNYDKIILDIKEKIRKVDKKSLYNVMKILNKSNGRSKKNEKNK